MNGGKVTVSYSKKTNNTKFFKGEEVVESYGRLFLNAQGIYLKKIQIPNATFTYLLKLFLKFR